MKKIVKILAILVSMTLVLNLQAFSVFGEEILPDPVIEMETEVGESIMPEEESGPADDTEEDADMKTEADAAEEPVAESTEPEEKLGDIEYKYHKPYEEAAYELKYHVLAGRTICIDGFTGEATGELVIPERINGNAVTMIGEKAFFECSGFTGNLTIPDSVKKIEEYAFAGCTGFNESLMISESVTTIGGYAFLGCQALAGSLTIPDSVKTIGEYAFGGCTGFNGSLIIPDSVKTIGNSAFYECSGFTGSLTIGDSVTTIGDWAFYGCIGLKGDLTIPDSVTTIGGYAFGGCTGFNGYLTIGNSVKTIGIGAFSYCKKLKGNLTLPDGVTTIGDNAFLLCFGLSGNLTLPDSVKTIGNGAFSGCMGLSGDLTIPDSVKTIGGQAFFGCNGFTGSLTIGDSVESIGDSAFAGCTGFNGNLTLPDSVTTIENYAFMGCSGFTGSLTIGDGVTEIGVEAFNGCSGFTGNLTIPDSVTTIGKDAFKNLGSFRKVVNCTACPYTLQCPDGVTWINVATGEQITGDPVTITNGTAIRSDFYEPLDLPYFTHEVVEAQTYTGKAIKPAVKVYFGTKALEEKTDYTIKFSNNTNVGTAVFTVIGKGNYSGKDSDSFEILKKSLTDADVILTEPAATKYTKKEQKPVPKITYNGMTLKKGKDFAISYFSDEGFREWCIPKEPGKYYLKITGTGNYEGELDTTFVIVNPKKKLMNTLKADKIADKPYANGEAIRLTDEELIIRDGQKILEKGTDYAEITDADYADNKYPGTAKVTIRGIENAGYTGTLTLTFKIKGTPINSVKITAPEDCVYNGRAQSPAPDVEGLTHGYDYDLRYEKNINAGKAKVTIIGKGGYTGSVTKTFTIKPARLFEDMITITGACTYTGSGIKPAVTVKVYNGGYELVDGVFKPIVTVMTEGVDYTLKYADNTEVNDGSGIKKPTVTVTGKGNLTGKADKTFVINAADINTCTLKIDDVVYKDKNGNWKPKKVTVLGADGKALKAGKDYNDKTIRYTSDPEGNDVILPDAKLDANKTVYVWVEAKGTNYNAGTVRGTYRIAKQDIGKLSASLDPKAYTGKEVKLSKGNIRWKSGGKITNDVTFDFDENSYKNNVNKGKATVVVKGTGNYGGTKTITFTIGSKGILWWWRNLFN